jgi:hypothetical protein
MQNREELRQKVHKGVKNTFGERGKDIIFRKKGGGDQYCIRTKIQIPVIFKEQTGERDELG